MMKQIQQMKTEIESMKQAPRRGRAYNKRPWMSDPTIVALPTVSTAPVLILNGPKDAVTLRWTKQRNDLIDKWSELGLYNKWQTWGLCATNDNKIQMVCHVHCVCHCTDMSNVCVCVCVYAMQCIDGSRELGWTCTEFDSRMEYLNTIRRKRGQLKQVSHTQLVVHMHVSSCVCREFCRKLSHYAGRFLCTPQIPPCMPPCSFVCRKFCRT